MANKPNEKLKSFDYTDLLGWSVSRYDKFTMCPRAYYYDYYGKYDTEYLPSRIQKLKGMTSVALETGNIVHDTIKVLLERLLKSEKSIDREKFIAYARQTTEENCAKKKFSEVYYKSMDAVSAHSLFGKIEQGLQSFLSSERFGWITQKAISNKTGWVIEPPGYGETRIEGMKAYCKVDFLFPVDGNICILDWKTGKADERKHRKQMLGYTSWACFHFDVKPEKVTPVIAYLRDGYNELTAEFNESDIRGFVDTVRRESGEMYGMLIDVERNIPREKSAFKQTEKTILCNWCNYRELCKK